MAEQLAITESGTLKPVSEFTAEEKWWCDGEDCNGDHAGPHVHPGWGDHVPRPVDLLTGRTIEPPAVAP